VHPSGTDLKASHLPCHYPTKSSSDSVHAVPSVTPRPSLHNARLNQHHCYVQIMSQSTLTTTPIRLVLIPSILCIFLVNNYKKFIR